MHKHLRTMWPECKGIYPECCAVWQFPGFCLGFETPLDVGEMVTPPEDDKPVRRLLLPSNELHHGAVFCLCGWLDEPVVEVIHVHEAYVQMLPGCLRLLIRICISPPVTMVLRPPNDFLELGEGYRSVLDVVHSPLLRKLVSELLQVRAVLRVREWQLGEPSCLCFDFLCALSGLLCANCFQVSAEAHTAASPLPSSVLQSEPYLLAAVHNLIIH
mmetsp:Transcript_52946/g.123984  ORF Transcript_52946/g.123984 Transcript_52946/m.123984 type:complete len:215 (-) Transcript_52946:352-996(-)